MRESLLTYPYRSTSATSMSLWSTCAALQLAAFEDLSHGGRATYCLCPFPCPKLPSGCCFVFFLPLYDKTKIKLQTSLLNVRHGHSQTLGFSLSLSRLFQQHKSLTEIVPALTPTRKSFREVVVEQNSGGMEQIYNSKNFVKNYTSKNFPPSFINICFTFHALNISA